MKETQPDYQRLIQRIDLDLPLIGLYDAPDPEPFAPLVTPAPGECIFEFYDSWLAGETLHLTKAHFGCGGCGRWMFGIEPSSQEDFIKFLVDDEGLKVSRELMQEWIDSSQPYTKSHPHIMIGPWKHDQWDYIQAIIFLVNPDQLSALVYGTQYHSAPEDPSPMIAPFGSGCMELIPFADLSIPQAAIGATDIAMRRHLPANILTVTVTRSMFDRLCQLDEKSFLYKPFLQTLRKVRGLPDL
jgi:hypothetical protein